jgi:hypothetical protein
VHERGILMTKEKPAKEMTKTVSGQESINGLDTKIY